MKVRKTHPVVLFIEDDWLALDVGAVAGPLLWLGPLIDDVLVSLSPATAVVCGALGLH